MTRQDVLNLIAEEREATAKALSIVLAESRTHMFAELVKEREENAKIRELLEQHKAERLADRKRLRALEKRADQSDKLAPVMAENTALSARVAELEAQAVKPALPAPDKLVLRPDAAKRPQVQRFAAWLRNMATETCSEIQRLQNRSSD